eukprot:1533696-Rhodomonas_salina.2
MDLWHAPTLDAGPAYDATLRNQTPVQATYYGAAQTVPGTRLHVSDFAVYGTSREPAYEIMELLANQPAKSWNFSRTSL